EGDKTALDVALEVAAEKPGSLEVLVDVHEQCKARGPRRDMDVLRRLQSTVQQANSTSSQ
ncbi:ANKRD50, partial [Symbiodinium sp. CCMP2456]